MRLGASKKILVFLLLTGMVAVAATSPFFLYNLAKLLLKDRRFRFSGDEKKVRDAFSYLKRKGFIMIEKDGHDIKMNLTKKGEKLARKYQIDDMSITQPEKWDKMWRVVIFDIPDSLKIQRNAFRRKLKELGFYSLQKSVWAHPFNCQKEINVLRDFFGLDKKMIEILLVKSIENDIISKKMRKVYKI